MASSEQAVALSGPVIKTRTSSVSVATLAAAAVVAAASPVLTANLHEQTPVAIAPATVVVAAVCTLDDCSDIGYGDAYCGGGGSEVNCGSPGGGGAMGTTEQAGATTVTVMTRTGCVDCVRGRGFCCDGGSCGGGGGGDSEVGGHNVGGAGRW